jgi:hypothetical protein
LIVAAALSCVRTAVQERIPAILRLYRCPWTSQATLAPVFPTGAP